MNIVSPGKKYFRSLKSLPLNTIGGTGFYLEDIFNMDYSEKWGVDVEEAVKLALMDLKCSRDEVEVTVLEQPSKGFFGIGSKLAKVRVEKKKTEEKEAADDIYDEAAINAAKSVSESAAEQKPKEKFKDKPHTKDNNKRNRKNKNRNEKKSGEHKRDLAESSLNIEVVDKSKLQDVEEHEALDFLKDITEKMGLNLGFSVKTGEDVVYIEMDGKDSGTIIGKRGQTLDSIQYLTSLVINKDKDQYIKVVIDAENYRAKRQKTLEQLANRLAAKVVKTKKYVRLEPMNPYERKIIHATLQQNPDVSTRSEGEEPYRRVVIELKK